MAGPQREPKSRSQRVSRLGLDLLASKVRLPPVRPGTVPRPCLIERLRGDGRPPIVSVVAPPGYGKTTLLAQWAERNGQPFAWVSVDEADNDPKVLLSYVAEALDAVEPLGERVFDALASTGSSVSGSVVPRLSSAFSSMTSPVALVLDDVHLLRNLECRSALSVLADHVPPGSRLALAGRLAPPLRIARLRAEGKLLEIGPGDLSLTPEEASSLLHNVRLALGPDEVAELHRRTEGWPAALYLAALCLREGSSFDHAALSFGGDDRIVSEYVESEFFARISRPQRAFLTRTAVLERMCGSLCDATLGLHESAATLADMARSNLLLVPLDRRGEWYRYHRLFRDMLLAELRRREPDLIPVLHRRAAQWCEDNGEPDGALEHRMQAGDTDAVANLAGVLAFPAYQHGRVATVERWFGWLEDRGAMESRPSVVVMAAMVAAMTGKPAAAERWATIAERADAAVSPPDGSTTTEPWLALLRALLCRGGPDQMRADAELAARTMAAGSFFQAAATFFLATAHLMAGDRDRANILFEDQVAQGRVVGAMIGPCMALAERALLAIGQGAWDHAGRYLSQARSLAAEAHLEEYPPVALMHAAAAQVALHHGDLAKVRAELTCAQRMRPDLTYALPHLAIQVRIELARCHLALRDAAAVRTLLHEAHEILRRRPNLGVFVQQVEDLRAELARVKGNSAPGASALTAAELRLLPLLSTHMSLPEIAEAMFLSRNTIRSQAYSVYRKLDVSSRSQAVTQARTLGLLDR